MFEWPEVANRRLHRHERNARGGQAMAGLRQPDWQCTKCYTRSFLSKSACRSCGKMKELQKDSYVDEKGLIAHWPSQSGDAMTSGVAALPTSIAKGLAQALAQSRHQLAQAKEMGMLEACIRVLECKLLKEEAEMKQAQPLGQKMDQARARFRRVVEAGEKAQAAMLNAQTNFEHAQQEVIQAHSDLHKLLQEAPLPAMPTPQVNAGLVKSLEALTGLVENLWNPVAGPPPDQLVQAIQESRAILQTSSVLLSQEGGAAVMIEAGDEQDPELWDQDEDEAEGMEGFEETHAPGRPMVELTQARKTAAECKPIMPPQQKGTRTEEPEALAKGSAPLSQVQRLSTRAMQNPRDTELDTLSQRACALIPALASS